MYNTVDNDTVACMAMNSGSSVLTHPHTVSSPHTLTHPHQRNNGDSNDRKQKEYREFINKTLQLTFY